MHRLGSVMAQLQDLNKLSPLFTLCIHIWHVEEGVLACWWLWGSETQGFHQIALDGHGRDGIQEDVRGIRHVVPRQVAMTQTLNETHWNEWELCHHLGIVNAAQYAENSNHTDSHHHLGRHFDDLQFAVQLFDTGILTLDLFRLIGATPIARLFAIFPLVQFLLLLFEVVDQGDIMRLSVD